MALYLYGITPHPAAIPPSAGVAGAPVRRVAHRDLAAVVADVAEEALAGPSARQLRRDLAAHADLLARLAEQTTVLPVRFGVALPDEDMLVRELLEPQYDALAADLRRLGGAAEVRLKATYDEQAVLAEVLDERPDLRRSAGGVRAATLNGRIALGEQVAQAVGAKKERDAQEILGRLAPLAREVTAEEVGDGLTAVRASLLVDRDRFDEFDAAVGQLQAEAGRRLRLACVGPLPPYSFVRVSLPAGVGV
jgi:hypothetical protein